MLVNPDSKRRAVDAMRVSAAARDRGLAYGCSARVRALRTQFTIAVAVTIGLVLVLALALSLLMTISSTAAFLVVGPLGAGALLVVARLLVTPIVGDVEALRSALAAPGLADRHEAARGPGDLTAPGDSRPGATVEVAAGRQRPEPADRARQDVLMAVARDIRGSVASLSCWPSLSTEGLAAR
jgi:hypothetical protein